MPKMNLDSRSPASAEDKLRGNDSDGVGCMDGVGSMDGYPQFQEAQNA
ncbi:MAG: hypothetical protein LAO04_11500 [Acidobacteriia bacterium]|nr:hypothetical protein [Terriglobia bacterium]